MKVQSRQTIAEDVAGATRPDTLGTHTWWLLSRETVSAERLVVNMGELPPRTAHQLHRHPNAEQALIVIRGGGLHLQDEAEPYEVTEGDCIYIPRNEWHGFANHTAGTTLIVSVYGGVCDRSEAGYELHPGPPYRFD